LPFTGENAFSTGNNPRAVIAVPWFGKRLGIASGITCEIANRPVKRRDSRGQIAGDMGSPRVWGGTISVLANYG
jgi:hypothetical protein